MKKKLFALIMALCMISSIMPVPAVHSHAYAEPEYCTCVPEEGETFTYDGWTGKHKGNYSENNGCGKVHNHAGSEWNAYPTYYVCSVCGMHCTHMADPEYCGICGRGEKKCVHSYTNYVSNNDAKCGIDGTKTATCDNGCGEKDTIADVGSKLEHKYTNYVSNNDATCKADGTKTATCDNGCGEKDT